MVAEADKIENNVPEHIVEAVAEGFPWECPCGEMHRNEESAAICRKCREYLSWEDFCEATPRFWGTAVKNRE